MRCWSCGTENDLGAVQTCAQCGAPLGRKDGLFRKPVVLGIAAALLLIQGIAFFWIVGLRGCR